MHTFKLAPQQRALNETDAMQLMYRGFKQANTARVNFGARMVAMVHNGAAYMLEANESEGVPGEWCVYLYDCDMRVCAVARMDQFDL